MSYLDSEPCINYERSWDTTETERTVALVQVWDNGTKSKVEVPIDDNTKGIKHLVMVTNEEFKLACEELQFEDEDLYIQYAKCLKGNTKFYWDNVMGEVEDADKTTVNFPTHQIDLIQAIVGEDQRDVLHEWMETRYKKPPNVHPIQHHARTLEIFRFMDAVPGIAPQADEATKKKWLFKSYPLKFRDEYHTSGRSLTTDTMLQVTTFMKKLYEIEERNRRIAGRKRGRSPSNYRGGGSKRQRNCGGESNNSRDSHNDGGRSNNGNNNKQRHSRKGNSHGRGGKHNDHRNDNNRKKSRVQDDEKCPLHTIWNQDIRGLSVVKISMVQTFAQRAIVKAMDAEPMNTEAANATMKMVPTTLSIVKRTTIWRPRAPTMCTTSISLAQ